MPPWRQALYHSSESPGYVRFGPFFLRTGEQFIRGRALHEPADEKERGAVGYPRRLLQIMRHDDHGEFPLQLDEKLLDPLRRDRVERRAGFVEQQHFRIVRQRARDAEPLLLPAGEPRRALAETVLHLIPERGTAQRTLDDAVDHASIRFAVDARTERDVVVDGFRKTVPALKDHAGPLAQRHHVGVRIVDIRPVEQDFPRVPRAEDGLVQAVDGAEERGLPAPRRPDERGDRSRVNVEIDLEQRLLLAVPEREIAGLQDPRRAGNRGAAGRLRHHDAADHVRHPNRPVMYASVRGSRGFVKISAVGENSTMSPCRKNAVKSDTRAACCMLCVTITTAMPARSSHTSSSTLCVQRGSSEAVGSSSSSTFGSVASARAMHSRCCWPPDIPTALECSRSFTSSQSAARRSAFSTISSIEPRPEKSCPPTRRPAATLSRMDMVGKGVGRWKTIPMCFRTDAGFIPGA